MMFFLRTNWNKVLLKAARTGRLDEVRRALRNGADVNAQDRNGDTALHSAVAMGFRRIAERLIEAGAQVNVFNKEDQTPLHLVGGIEGETLLDLLISKGAYISAGVEAQKATPLHNAAFNGLLHIVRKLLNKNAEINARDGNLLTPLHCAAMQGHSEIAALLIARGAEPDTADRRGATPLFLAALHGHPDVAELLLVAGADPNMATWDDGSTPLHASTLHGQFEVAKLLVEHGARLKTPDYSGQRPMDIAWNKARMDIYRFLEEQAKKSTKTQAAGNRSLEKG